MKSFYHVRRRTSKYNLGAILENERNRRLFFCYFCYGTAVLAVIIACLIYFVYFFAALSASLDILDNLAPSLIERKQDIEKIGELLLK